MRQRTTPCISHGLVQPKNQERFLNLPSVRGTVTPSSLDIPLRCIFKPAYDGHGITQTLAAIVYENL